jgi:hypothetical protein
MVAFNEVSFETPIPAEWHFWGPFVAMLRESIDSENANQKGNEAPPF